MIVCYKQVHDPGSPNGDVARELGIHLKDSGCFDSVNSWISTFLLFNLILHKLALDLPISFHIEENHSHKVICSP